MKLSELASWKFDASKSASDQARTLALAGMGIVWLFAGPFFTGEVDDQPARSLQVAGGLLALALALDLAQLVGRTVALEANYYFKNRASDPDDPDPEVRDTRGVNGVSGTFFYLKITALCAGYIAIIWYFATSAW